MIVLVQEMMEALTLTRDGQMEPLDSIMKNIAIIDQMDHLVVKNVSMEWTKMITIFMNALRLEMPAMMIIMMEMMVMDLWLKISKKL